MAEASVGAIFACYTVVYMLAAFPIGVLVDRYSAGAQGRVALKLVQLVGHVSLLVGALALGPLSEWLNASSRPEAARWMSFLAIVFCYGAGTAIANIPSLPGEVHCDCIPDCLTDCQDCR